MQTDNLDTRYSRQLPLPGFGISGQEKLGKARVLVIGAGGLGCPVIQYLSAAGVGTIGIADGDMVELSNLHRQVLYTSDDIGKLKANVAAQKINTVDPNIHVKVFTGYVTNKNALSLIGNYDIIVDCTDNFIARYLINDACSLLEKPLVFGAVFQYEGQVAVFNAGTTTAPKISYRDLFPEPPSAFSAPDCNTAGVLGVLPGLIGLMQATEVIKIIAGLGEVLDGKLLSYDIRTHQSMIMEIQSNEEAVVHIPKDRETYEKLDYAWLCNADSGNAVDKVSLHKMLEDGTTIAIDVREPGEMPEADFPHQKIPMSLIDSIPDMHGYKNIVVFCQSGVRSAKALVILSEKYGSSKKVFHLAGGLTGYNLQNNE
ncbi:MAG: HesA/MoeB/ThiF family protein [Bacteroidota bacterium]